MAEYNHPNAQPPKFFSKEDILELLVAEGYDETNCFIEPQGYNLITELAHNFVEEILDTYRNKKRDISVGDIRRAIALKFPETSNEDNSQNKQILQNRSNALDENDDRVREVLKKFNE